MERFTNINIKKEKNRMIRNLIIFILVIGVAIVCWVWRKNTIDKITNSEATNLNDIIVNEDEKINRKAYLDIKDIPYQCVVIEDTTDSYYIVSDGTYMYIAYMGLGDFEKLNNEEIRNNPIRVEGITCETNEEVKKVVLEVYNEGIEEQYQIKESEFDDYFGSIHLDMVKETETVATIPTLLTVFIGFVGMIGLCLTIREIYSYKNSIKKMDEYQIKKLDEEMNDPNAFYYNKAHLYLTDQYVINFKNKFVVIDYNDIVWMYTFEQRTNGIKASQAIKVLDHTGQTYTIAEIEFITKAKKEVYNEIWNTIISKNNRIVLGYTKENIKEMNDRFKKNRL